MRARSTLILFAAAVVVTALQGCAKPAHPSTSAAPPSDPRTDQQILEQLRSGAVSLGCGSECEAAWTGVRPKLKSLYDAQDWRALAVAVSKVGFEQDLGYYYLGRAAEELRFYGASVTYYRDAVRLATEGDLAARCRGKSDRCDGFLLPADALQRIPVATQEARARGPAVARRGGPAKSPAEPKDGAGAPTQGEPPDGGAQTGGGLIDPPPVER